MRFGRSPSGAQTREGALAPRIEMTSSASSHAHGGSR